MNSTMYRDALQMAVPLRFTPLGKVSRSFRNAACVSVGGAHLTSNRVVNSTQFAVVREKIRWPNSRVGGKLQFNEPLISTRNLHYEPTTALRRFLGR